MGNPEEDALDYGIPKEEIEFIDELEFVTGYYFKQKPDIRDDLDEYGELYQGFVIQNGHITKLSICFDREKHKPFPSDKIPLTISNLVALEEIYIQGFPISSILESLHFFKNLKKIHILYTGFQGPYPKGVFEIPSLKKLVIESPIPSEIGSIPNLEELFLLSKINEIPDSIGRLKKLKKFVIRGPPPSSISPDSKTNEKPELPSTFCDLESLEWVSISKTHLTKLPDDIGKLRSLSTLDLSGCGLQDLLPSLGRLNNLEILDLSSNPLSNIDQVFTIIMSLDAIKAICVDEPIVIRLWQKLRDFFYDKVETSKDLTELIKISKKMKKWLILLILNRTSYSSNANPTVFKEPGDFAEVRESDSQYKKTTNYNLIKSGLLNENWDFLEDIYALPHFWNNVLTNGATLSRLGSYSNLGRFTIFVGKNNSGKTFALKSIKRILNAQARHGVIEVKNMKGQPIDSLPSCFYIPNKRVFISSQGRRYGLKNALEFLNKILVNLQEVGDSIDKPLELDNVLPLLDVFSYPSRGNESPSPEFQKKLRLLKTIYTGWKRWIGKFFPDIKFNPVKPIEMDTEVTYEGHDAIVDGVQYQSWNDLGSGNQELLIIVFIIEMLKFLPVVYPRAPPLTPDFDPVKWFEIWKLPPAPRLLLLDEPEISLHPSLLRLFFKYLEISSNFIQIIITTQSPNVPKPIQDRISLKLFFKDEITKCFEILEVNEDNFIRVEDSLHNYDAYEIANVLARNDYECVLKPGFDTWKLKMVEILKEKIHAIQNTTPHVEEWEGILDLGTSYEVWRPRMLQNAILLSIPIETIDLNGEDSNAEENLEKVILCQLNINDSDLRCTEPLSEEEQKKKRRERFDQLCKKFYENPSFKENHVLKYKRESSLLVSDTIKQWLNDISKQAIIIEGKTLLVFPENSLPYSILDLLIQFARNHKVIIVGGLEHEIPAKISDFLSTLQTLYPNQYCDSGIKWQDSNTRLAYCNQAIIINSNGKFTFQVKNYPVKEKITEGITPIFYPSIRKVITRIGAIAVFICKDFLVNYEVIPHWMEKNHICKVIIPSFSSKIKPFINKLEEIAYKEKHSKLYFIYVNTAEYGYSEVFAFPTKVFHEPKTANPNQVKDRQEKWLCVNLPQCNFDEKKNK